MLKFLSVSILLGISISASGLLSVEAESIRGSPPIVPVDEFSKGFGSISRSAWREHQTSAEKLNKLDEIEAILGRLNEKRSQKAFRPSSSEPKISSSEFLNKERQTNLPRWYGKRNLIKPLSTEQKLLDNPARKFVEETKEKFHRVESLLQDISLKNQIEKTPNPTLRDITRPHETNFTTDQIEEFQQWVNQALSNLNGRGVDSKCEINVNKTGVGLDCVAKIMECGVSHLSSGLDWAISREATLDDLDDWNKIYTKVHTKYVEIIDGVKDSVEKDKMKELLDDLQMQLEIMQKSVQILIDRVKAQQMKVFVTKISNGQAQDAAQDFEIIDNDIILREIIKACAVTKRSDMPSRVIDFLVNLSKLSTIQVGVDQLEKEIQLTNGTMASPATFILLLKVLEMMKVNDLHGPDQESVTKMIQFLEQTVVTTWSVKVQQNDLTEILSMTKDHPKALIQNGLISKIIEAAYDSNLKNFENIVLYIQKQPTSELALATSLALLKAMTKSEHLDNREVIRLAYVTLEAAQKEGKVSEIKNQFPSAIRTLVFENTSKCHIKNHATQEYLCATKFQRNLLFSTRRYVLTWTEKTADEQSDWQIKPSDKKAGFTIKNVKYNELMYEAIDTPYDNRRTYVFTTDSKNLKPDQSWDIIPANNGNAIKIVSKQNGHLVFNDEEAQFKDFVVAKRRYVFTSSDERLRENGRDVWEIEC